MLERIICFTHAILYLKTSVTVPGLHYGYEPIYIVRLPDLPKLKRLTPTYQPIDEQTYAKRTRCGDVILQPMFGEEVTLSPREYAILVENIPACI